MPDFATIIDEERKYYMDKKYIPRDEQGKPMIRRYTKNDEGEFIEKPLSDDDLYELMLKMGAFSINKTGNFMLRGTKKYNKELLEIDHFTKHPQMIPFVGKYWGQYKKLLILGESHCMPDDFPKDTIEDVGWTNTVEIIDKTWYEDKEHVIFKNIDHAIIDSGFCPGYIFGENSFCFISFMNFFQRPALNAGEAILPNKDDIEIANETLIEVVNILKPDYLFFASRKARDCLKEEWFKDLLENGKVGFSSDDGRTLSTGKQAFINFLQKNHIPK